MAPMHTRLLATAHDDDPDGGLDVSRTDIVAVFCATSRSAYCLFVFRDREDSHGQFPRRQDVPDRCSFRSSQPYSPKRPTRICRVPASPFLPSTSFVSTLQQLVDPPSAIQKRVCSTGWNACDGRDAYLRTSGDGAFCDAKQVAPKLSVIARSLETLTFMPVSWHSVSAPSRKEPPNAAQRTAASRAVSVAFSRIPSATRSVLAFP